MIATYAAFVVLFVCAVFATLRGLYLEFVLSPIVKRATQQLRSNVRIIAEQNAYIEELESYIEELENERLDSPVFYTDDSPVFYYTESAR